MRYIARRRSESESDSVPMSAHNLPIAPQSGSESARHPPPRPRDRAKWVSCELEGYRATVPASVARRLDATGRRVQTVQSPAPEAQPVGRRRFSGRRRIKRVAAKIYRESLPRIEDHILPSVANANRLNEQRIEGLKRRKAAGFDIRLRNFNPTQWEIGIQRTKEHLIALNQIVKRVRGELHAYVVETYHRFAFSEVANAIFDRHKTTVDSMLRATAEEVIEKIPAIYDRLAAAPDPEAVSQAMVSCRRMIAAFADAVCPPRTEPAVDEAGGTHKLTQQEVLNRIDEHLKKCASRTRRERLSKTLRALYDRVSAGVKDDITPSEAQSLFLATYLTLGEIAEATGST
jgi:hypothetical protein